MKKKSLVVLSIALLFSGFNMNYAEAATETVVFDESMSSNRSKTITLPENAFVKSVTSNTGNASYSRNGNQLTVYVSGGSPSSSYWNSTKYSKYIYKTETSSYDSFPYSYSYSDGDGYYGSYTKSGGSYHYSGEVVLPHTIRVTDYRETGVGGSSSSLPGSISYNSGGYVGTMYGQGVNLIRGSESETKYWTTTEYAYHRELPFPSSITYNAAGYTGRMTKLGSYTLTGGDAYDSTSTAVSSSCNRSPSCYISLQDMAYSRFFARSNYNPQAPGYKTLSGSTDYTGYVTKSGTPYVNIESDGREVYRQLWTGTVTRPESRRYSQRYGGDITKPSTAVYAQSYAGDATKPGYNTYLYGQNYSGYAYKGGTDYYYRYNVTIDYGIDTEKPDGILTANPTTWTNKDVTLTLSDVEDFGDAGLYGVYLPNGTFVSGTTVPYTVGGNGTYTFIIEDNANNRTSKTITVNNIDKTPPQADLSSSNTSFTNQNISLNLTNIRDTGVSGLKEVEMPDGKVEKTFTNKSFEVTQNGTYSFKVRDNAGNETVKTMTVSNIDKQKPSATLTQTPTSLTNGNVTLMLRQIVDNGVSGLKSITLPNGNKVAPNDVNFVVTTNGDYTFTIEDNAGNIETKTIRVSNIDKTLPIANLFANTTDFTNEDVVLNLTEIFDGGVAGLESVKVPNGQLKTTFGDIAYPVSQNGNYRFEIRDKAGNVTVKDITVSNIDKQAPDFTTDFTPKVLNKGPVQIQITNVRDTGVSGVSKMMTSLTGELPPQSSYNFLVSENGSYEFVLLDKAGNETKKVVEINNIDNLPPIADINWERAWTKGSVVIELSNFKDDGPAGYKSTKLPNGIVVTGSKNYYTVTDNGTYNFHIEDHVGNVRVMTVVVENIDKEKPIIDLEEKDKTDRDVKALIKIRDANSKK